VSRPKVDVAQRTSDVAALTLTALLISVLSALGPTMLWRDVVGARRSATPSRIELSLESPPAESMPAPAPPIPVLQVTHTHRERAKPVMAATTTPVPAETVLADPEAVPDDAPVIAASEATSPAAAQPSASRPDLDAQYAAGVRSDIDRRTRVPDTAQYRLRRPSGEVRVGFALTRAGEPKAVTLRRSSGSTILDEAALTIVASGHYPLMPANVFTGEAEHVFAVTIEFRGASLALRTP
jgi:TonB family protein